MITLQRGFVLVTALLFLCLLSLSVMMTMENIILQHKLLAAMQSQQTLFAEAEAGLAIGEANLNDYHDEDLQVKVKYLTTITCEASPNNDIAIKYYQIMANAKSGLSHVTLISTYAKFPAAIKTCAGIDEGRQSWLMANKGA